MIRVLCLTLAFVFAVSLCASSARASDDLPPVFDTRPYAEAKKAAEDAKKWFIVKGTAVWCGPCKQMDKTTWRDDKVVKWLEKSAIVVALDVDKEPKLAKRLGIQAMPTMIAFKDGDKEFDRVVGYKAPEVMLAWLEGVGKGERSIEAVEKRASAPKGEPVDVRAKLDLALALMRKRNYVKSADEYVWLWKNMLLHDQAMYGVRLSFMAKDMQRLSKQSKEAREKFVALRDETGKRLEGEMVEAEDVADWIVLNNRVLNDADATVRWFERVKDQPKWQPFIRRESRNLSEMFIELNRWADVGRLSTDPLGELDSDWEILKMTPKFDLPRGLGVDQRKQVAEIPNRIFREKSGQRYAGLLAAGKAELAAKFADRSRKYDTSAEMVKALVSSALEADQSQPAHKEWIAGTNDKSLIKRVAEALKKKPPAK